MRIRHFFATSAIACGLAFTSFAPTAVAHEGPDTDHPQCVRGRAHGAWDLPDGDGPGMASGILFRRDGRPALGMDVQLLPPHHPGERGRIRGVLHTLASPGNPARRVANVVGEFGLGDDGHGRYRALFVRMSDDGTMDEPMREIIGGIHGRFHDPRRAPGQADPGPFGGRWVVCRR